MTLDVYTQTSGSVSAIQSQLSGADDSPLQLVGSRPSLGRGAAVWEPPQHKAATPSALCALLLIKS